MAQNGLSMQETLNATGSKQRLRSTGVAAAMLLACGLAAADMSESVEFRYYTATQRAGETLASSVIKASPVRERGKTYMGQTAWTLKWDLNWQQQRNGKCTLGEVRTHLHAIVTLPQMALADAGDRARFEAFSSALRRHELDHVAIARDAAREIERRLQRMPPMKNCKALQTQANGLGQRLLAEARRKGIEFDKKTGHGRTQGAVLR